MDAVSRIASVECSHIVELIRIGEETNLSPWSAQSYLDEMKNPDAIMLRLVSAENETIGFTVGRLVGGGTAAKHSDAEIYNVAVIKEHQRRGDGQRLLDRFLSEAKARSAESVWLEV